MIEQGQEPDPYSVTRCDSIYKTDSLQLQQKSSHGKQSLENSSGSSKVEQTNGAWRNSLLTNIVSTLSEDLQFGPPMPTLKGRLLDTSTMNSPKSLAQSMELSGASSTTTTTDIAQSTRSWMLSDRYKPILTQEELSFRHGTLYRPPKWPYRPVTYSRSFGSLTVS